MTALIAGIVVFAALLAWELWISEGAHLGRKFVVRLYDLAATRYDRIKGFEMEWEAQFLGSPVANLLADLPQSRLLDVGAGTGRTARALRYALGSDSGSSLRDLLAAPSLLLGLEPSARMLELGRARAGPGFEWIRAWAVPLPFGTQTFDMVVCVEVLEFTPDPRLTLAEIHRVLRPGGWLLTTNRIGWQAPLILGRTFRPVRFTSLLGELDFIDIELRAWQVDYDMAWARKRWA